MGNVDSVTTKRELDQLRERFGQRWAIGPREQLGGNWLEATERQSGTRHVLADGAPRLSRHLHDIERGTPPPA